jgi:hypothetical protein
MRYEWWRDTMGDEFVVKDSGEKIKFESGMVRDAAKDKVDYLLALDGPMFERWAAHLQAACVPGPNGEPAKYEPRNWMKATGPAELQRFRASALRHLLQWLRGDRDEDHAAAVMFNLNGAEYVKGVMALRVDMHLDPMEPIRAGYVSAREVLAGQERKKDQ